MDKIIEGLLDVVDKLIDIKMSEGSYYYDDYSKCRLAVKNLKALYKESI